MFAYAFPRPSPLPIASPNPPCTLGRVAVYIVPGAGSLAQRSRVKRQVGELEKGQAGDYLNTGM